VVRQRYAYLLHRLPSGARIMRMSYPPVRCVSISLLVVSFAYSDGPQTFKVLRRFPLSKGTFECTLSEIRPGVFVGSFDTTPSEIFRLTNKGSFSVLATLSQAVEGNNPQGPLFPGSDAFIYGSTTNYGTNPQNLGVLFRMGANGALSVVSNQISLSSPVIRREPLRYRP
jgi:hypothetical protein